MYQACFRRLDVPPNLVQMAQAVTARALATTVRIEWEATVGEEEELAVLLGWAARRSSPARRGREDSPQAGPRILRRRGPGGGAPEGDASCLSPLEGSLLLISEPGSPSAQLQEQAAGADQSGQFPGGGPGSCRAQQRRLAAMGGSASSQLDEGKCAYIRGKTEAAIKNFSPYYSRQYSVAFCNHVRSEVEQQRDLMSQFLKTKPPLTPGTILYEAELSQFSEDIKKWKERYVVVKNDYAVESYENKEAYQRGAAPKSRILPAGGKVLTSEDEYNLLSDRHFPDPLASSEKENAQPFVVLPKEFPVYLWQPFLRHGYFCFHEAADQKRFSALLSDCIRHLNHGMARLPSSSPGREVGQPSLSCPGPSSVAVILRKNRRLAKCSGSWL
ncbi:PREDICTED: protein Niban-like [Mandrillus leucophaeus]|uniref:protein Niban-like n=1 Tax=Mandrillus leucophaeus TaxID=9568 RepID=UPI0005F4E10F|nr:PREDICTED: protein Niban-like [Mandrillus leucophaeus]